MRMHTKLKIHLKKLTETEKEKIKVEYILL